MAEKLVRRKTTSGCSVVLESKLSVFPPQLQSDIAARIRKEIYPHDTIDLPQLQCARLIGHAMQLRRERLIG